MSQKFKFSDPGEGLQEAEVLEIHVAKGDHVNDGDTILTVETDKAATDIQAPFTGTIEKVHLKTGDVVRVDDVLLSYAPDDGDGEDSADSDEQDKKDKKEDEKGKEEEQSNSDDEAESSEESGRESSEQDEKKEGQETHETETGRDESEEQGDRQKRDEEGEEKQQEKQSDKLGKKAKRDQPPVPAAPSTRRLARERGVDLHDIEPSGPQGRVTTEDVEAAAKEGARQSSGSGKEPSKKTEAAALPDFSQWGDTEREAIRSVRRVTAERMTQSWTQVPHVYHQDIADVTELERFRHDYEASAQERGGKFTLTILVMKAMVFALKQFPRFNASLDEENQEIVLKRYFHVGLAVATDRGLLVPVIRDVDKKNLIELTEAVSTTVERARNGELGREDMEGGCMTLTNPGPLGGTALTPLINLPEVAILGLGQARLEPVVHGDLDHYEIKPRLLLPLSLGFDHRVNDGADAANFVTTLIGALEDPQSLLLKI